MFNLIIPSWKNDSVTNRPENEKELLASLNLLETHFEWVSEHEERAHQLFAHLMQTDLSGSSPVFVKARALQRSLLRSHPHFFPCITFQVEGEQIKVPSILLQEKSEKFRRICSEEWKSNLEKPLVLECSGIDKTIFKDFLNFFLHGNAPCTMENSPHFLRLAQEHLVPELSVVCIQFLEHHVRFDSLAAMLQLAIQYNILDLKWHCLRIISKHRDEPSIFHHAPNFCQNKESIELLEEGIRCREMGIEPCFSEKNKIRTVRIKQPPQDLFFYKELFEKHCVEGIKIGENVSHDDLHRLNKILKCCRFLSFSSKDIFQIPSNWLSHIIEVECSKCPFTRLELPVADSVILRDCSSLVELEIPLAKRIICEGTSNETLFAPSAEMISFKNSRLVKLFAPLAKKVIAQECYMLRFLETPSVEELVLNQCNMESINVEQAKKVIATNCARLEKIEAPLAYEVIAFANKNLKFLECPNARKIEVYDTSIKQLDAPNAEFVNCSKCEHLEELDLPEALIVNVTFCWHLHTLKVGKARNINCTGLPLKFLEAPQAEEIDCSKTLITKLLAPQAVKIDCQSTPLVILKAPVVKELNCFQTKLTQLKIPKALKVNCSLTPLVFLDAPLVEELDCSRTSVQEVSFPKAIFVNAQHCSQMTQLVCPSAKEVKCSNSQNLKKLGCEAVETLFCMDCISLPKIEAPNAKRVVSKRCRSLKEIDAPLAKTVSCEDCHELHVLHAPQVQELDYGGCDKLASDQIPKALQMRTFHMLNRIKRGFKKKG